MTTVSIATLIAFAATLAHDTESRPMEVREWCERQTGPVDVPLDGLAVFADAGLIVLDGRLRYAECIGQPGGARCYGEFVVMTTARDLAVQALAEPTDAEIRAYAALHGLTDLGEAASCLRSLADRDAIDAVDRDFGV